jgi:NitT/TauT family transport system ATP-binding protein
MNVDTFSESSVLLEFKEVSFSYSSQPIISLLSWNLKKGEFQSFLGRSGCGKSTFLDIASGLMKAQQGIVEYNGQPVLKPISDIGFVFQCPTLLDWMNVSENILLPKLLNHTTSVCDRDQVNELLVDLGIPTCERAYPWQLSGGQQSRVAIARALINGPKILMMDEPFAALDAITREELQELLLNICRTHGIAVIFVTHDVQEAVFLSDRVCLMSNGQIVEYFPINLPKIRVPEIRYEQQFNEQTAKIKLALIG